MHKDSSDIKIYQFHNTLRDAQKRQKEPLIVVKSSLFITSRRITRDFRVKYTRKHLAEHYPVNSSELLHKNSEINGYILNITVHI